jgi:hypothetical protein
MGLIVQNLAVFVSMFVLDIIWANYISYTADKKALAASCFAAGTIIVGSFVTIEYVNNHWLVIPAAVGSFLGTLVTVWYKKRHG